MSAPDFIEPFAGYRLWDFSPESGELTSPYAPGCVWDAESKQAQCPNSDEALQGHIAPDKTCQCGLYSVNHPHSLPFGYGHVVGLIEQWGNIEVHETGMRSEYARIIALAHPDESEAFPREAGQREKRQLITRLSILISVLAIITVPGLVWFEHSTLAMLLGITIPFWIVALFGIFAARGPKSTTRWQKEMLEYIRPGLINWAEQHQIPLCSKQELEALHEKRKISLPGADPQSASSVAE